MTSQCDAKDKTKHLFSLVDINKTICTQHELLLYSMSVYISGMERFSFCQGSEVTLFGWVYFVEVLNSGKSIDQHKLHILTVQHSP